MTEDRKDMKVDPGKHDHDGSKHDAGTGGAKHGDGNANQGGKTYLFDNPRNVKLVIRGLLVLCLILVILDLIIHRHSVHPWEHIFAFYPIYGFVSCVVLVLLAKELRKVVMRSENYYDPYPDVDPFDDDGNQEHHDA